MKLKRIGFLTLISLFTASLSGAGVYLSLGVVDSIKNQANNVTDYELPTIDDEVVVEETPFSKTINSLINAKEIYNGDISVSLKPKNTDKVSLNVKNLNVDLSQLNTSVINIASDIQVLYGGIDQTASFRIENDEACYVSFDQSRFMFNIPQNLSDLMHVLRACGILVPNAGEGTEELNLKEIISTLQKEMDKIKVSSESVFDGDVIFKISMEDLIIKNTKISNIELVLLAEQDTYALKGIRTVDGKDLSIQNRKDESSPFEEILSLAIDGCLSLRQASGYKTLDGEELASYKNVTSANSALLSTVSEIIGNGSDVDIDISLDKKVLTKSNVITIDDTGYREKSCSHHNITGLMQASINNGDFKNGSYALSLNHLNQIDDDSSEVLNDLYAAHINKKTYLRLNQLLKAKVDDSSLNDIFSIITEGTGKEAIQVIANQMNTTLGKIDIKAIKDGDFSIINDLINSDKTYFDYDQVTHSFLLSCDGELLGITSSNITLEIKLSLNETEASKNGVEYIKISGLEFTKANIELDEKTTTSLSITLTPKALTKIEDINDDEYSDFKGVVPIFDEISNIIAKKQFLASYQLSFNDKINDGTDNHFNTILASGKLGADLSGVSSPKFLDGIREGTYYLSLSSTAAESAYQHNLDITYQNKNLYFGFDSVVKEEKKNDSLHDVTVFKNYLENAQLGQIKDILNSKTSSNVSDVFIDSGKILNILGTNEKFIDDISMIKKGSLRGLDSFLTIKAEDIVENNISFNQISLKVDTSSIFKADSLLGKNIGNIILTLNSYPAEEKLEFKDIRIETVISADQDFSFELSFLDYVDPSLNDVSSYQRVDDAVLFTKAFYNLGTQLEKYGVKINAEYKKDPVLDEKNDFTGQYSSNIAISGNCYWDFSDKDNVCVSGGVVLSHPYIAFEGIQTRKENVEQKINFGYQKNTTIKDGIKVKEGRFTADYNDKMHLVMHSQTVMDIIDSVSRCSETSLLNYLLSSLSDMASSMPIKDVISQKAPSLLLDYPYINSVEFNSQDNYIQLQIDKRLFSLSDEGELISLKIYYDEGNDSAEPSLTKMVLDICNTQEKVISAAIELVSYQEDELPILYEYNDETKNQFVNLDGLKNLAKMAVDTSEFNYLRTSGRVNLDLTLFAKETFTPINLDAFCIDLRFDISIYIYQEEVNLYFKVALGDNDLSQAGYYVTEYAFKEGKVYINNTKTTAVLDDEKIVSKIENKAFRVTKEEFKNNILYYLVSLGLDMDSRIAGKTIMANIYDALKNKEDENTTAASTSSLTSLTKDLHINLNSDFSTLLSSKALYDEEKKKFAFHFDLNSLLSVVVSDGDDSISLLDFSSTYLKIYHQSRVDDNLNLFTPFYALELGSEISVLDGLLKVSLKGQLISNANNGDLLYLEKDNEDDKQVLQGKMERFYTLTSTIDNKVAADYQIDDIALKKKIIYSFTKDELDEFINDYEIIDNGNNLYYSLLLSDEDFATKINTEQAALICK